MQDVKSQANKVEVFILNERDRCAVITFYNFDSQFWRFLFLLNSQLYRKERMRERGREGETEALSQAPFADTQWSLLSWAR